MIKRNAVHLVSTVLLFSFSAITLLSQNKITREEYIRTYKDWVIQDMKQSGVPASIKLAQGLLESDNGNSKLAVDANNHFGIKCHNDWSGERVFHHDDARNECFRKYDSPLLSFEDHTQFLTTRSRYSKLFELDPTDYKGWAYGLKEAGYATNTQYPQLLIKIIEDNQLNLLDEEGGDEARQAQKQLQQRRTTGNLVINPFVTRKVEYNNGVKYIFVEEGDTYESITNLYKLRDWELGNYNDIPKNTDIKKYRFLYIESKRKKAHPNHATHIVKNDESMHSISQQYGIRMRRLFYYNNMESGERPEVGDKLNLRKKARP
jgi:hypothetical protein